MNKYLKTIAISGILLSTVACSEDKLNLNDPNSLTSLTAFSSEKDINASLTGVYHAFYCNWYSQFNAYQFSVLSDEVTTYANPDIQQYVKRVFSNINFISNPMGWNRLYEQIARCNQVITYAEKIQDWDIYEKEQILAQAKAVRAYDYYQLAMMYQIAPYVDYIAPASDQPAQSTFDELCQHIIDDALYAYNTLPESYFKNYNGNWPNQYRITKWFAACVLAKTYMNWGDYTSGGYRYSEALPIFEDIVKNGGFEMTPDYTQNFNINSENNIESIFEIQNESSANGWRNYYDFDNNATNPSQSTWRWKFFAPNPLGWGDFNGEVWIKHAFKNEKAVNGGWDERIPATIFYDEIFNDFPGHVQWQQFTSFDQNTNWSSNRVYINKYVAQYSDANKVNADNSEGTNIILFRFGEVLLDYAECLAQTGNLTKAVEVIDQVRQRAGLCKLGERQDYKVVSAFNNSETNTTIDFNGAEYGYQAFEKNSTSYTLEDIMAVLDIESMKESAFECERLIDIRRWGIGQENSKVTAKAKKRSYKYYTNYKPVQAWIPMPTADVNNNPNLSQLPGW